MLGAVFRPAPSLLKRPLLEGPLDVLGDVHGGLNALQSLISSLGYDQSGGHPDHRSLVFVGDLVDRGEDSSGVVDLVAEWMNNGHAQCVLGNHELNILLGEERMENQWFYRQPFRVQSKQRAFFASLPLLLEREDLRVVHACWDGESAQSLPRESEVGAWSHAKEAEIRSRLDWQALDGPGRALLEQNRNPVKVLTSGLEKRTPEGVRFWAGGKWRRTQRVAWWEDYRDSQAVVFGHYWRTPVHQPHSGPQAPPALFPRWRDVFAPLGPRQNAWCVDLSNGRRAALGAQAAFPRQDVHKSCALAALRWPEREWVLV